MKSWHFWGWKFCYLYEIYPLSSLVMDALKPVGFNIIQWFSLLLGGTGMGWWVAVLHACPPARTPYHLPKHPRGYAYPWFKTAWISTFCCLLVSIIVDWNCCLLEVWRLISTFIQRWKEVHRLNLAERNWVTNLFMCASSYWTVYYFLVGFYSVFVLPTRSVSELLFFLPKIGRWGTWRGGNAWSMISRSKLLFMPSICNIGILCVDLWM